MRSRYLITLPPMPRGTPVQHADCLACGRPVPGGATQYIVLGRYEHHGALCASCDRDWNSGQKGYAKVLRTIRAVVAKLERGTDA